MSAPISWTINPTLLERIVALWFVVRGHPLLPRRFFWDYAVWELFE